MTIRYPVIERIAQTIFGRLRNVTTGAGYNVTLNPVRQVRIGVGTLSPKDLDAVITQGDPQPDGEMTTEGNPRLVASIQPFEISIFRRPSDKSDTPIEQAINLAVADCTMGLQVAEVDGEDWREMNGLAYDAQFDPPTEFPLTDGQFAGVTVRLNVSYRTPENDLYTAG